MTKIKICGLRRMEDIQTVNEIRPDYVGFILWEKSRRYVTIPQLRELKKALSPDIPAVGVFVNQDPESICSLLEEGLIDIAQLHGQEPESDIWLIQERTGKPVWKAFTIRSSQDILTSEHSPANCILLDNGYGTGQQFDWSLLDRPGVRCWILAGGLTPENLPDAICTYRPNMVDISSGVETGGWKDKEKIKAAVEAVRAIQ